MSGWWLASYLALWALGLATVIVLLIVLRQLGLIYLRTSTGGFQLDEGPGVGSVVGPFTEVDDREEEFRFPSPRRGFSALLFASPHCAICEDAIRGLRAVARHRDVEFVVVSEGELDENEELRQLANGRARFVTSVARQRQLGIQTIPYGIVANREGVVLAKGIVNSVDDLDNMLDAAESHTSVHVEPTLVKEER